MGITDGICDSCEEEPAFLFPIAVLDELPSGGTKIVTKYYCIVCYLLMMDTAKEDLKEQEEEEEEEKEPDYNINL